MSKAQSSVEPGIEFRKALDFCSVVPVAEGELLGATVALGDTEPSHVVIFISSNWFPASMK